MTLPEDLVPGIQRVLSDVSKRTACHQCRGTPSESIKARGCAGGGATRGHVAWFFTLSFRVVP